MKKHDAYGSPLPVSSQKAKLKLPFRWTAFLMALLPLAAAAQTTYDFSAPASILKENATDYYYMKAEFTSAGVDYVISGGINGSYSNSSNGGYNNTASLKKEAANQVTATIKRKDGKAFQFYGLWVNYNNLSYGYGPGFKMDYKYGCTVVKTYSNAALSATVNPYDGSGTAVSELTLTFSYLTTFFLDNFVAGPVGNLPPAITPGNCGDLVRDVSIPSNTKDIANIVAADDNGDPLTYSLSGEDAALLTIDASGNLAFKNIPVTSTDANGDGIYTVVVTVSDGNGGSDSQTINITILEADIVFDGCQDWTWGAVGYLVRTAALDVSQDGITRYGYSTSQSFYDANYFSINIRWDAATSSWLISSEDDYYAAVLYSSSVASYPYPPDAASGNWVANTSLPGGYGSCGTITTLSGQVTGSPAAATTLVSAGDITASTATLTGTINDNLSTTNVSFDYGSSSGLATFQTVDATPSVISAGSGETTVSASITGLQPNTTYYYRVQASNTLGTTSGQIESFTTATTLPVNLLRFNAEKENDGTVTITWSTAGETNNRYFSLERSTDGNHFSSIAGIEGKGSSGEAANYLWHDRTPFAGINYYRLRQVDFDGTEKLLGIRKVDMGRETTVQVYPNPAQNQQIWIYSRQSAGAKLSFTLTNLTGNILASGVMDTAATSVSTAGWPSGIYLLSISNGQKIKVHIR